MKRGMAVAAVAGWYAFALAILHPLSNGPVADSWLYGEAARWFCDTGEIRFAGFTEAMPVAQAVYGGIWARLFGGSARSLDLSCAILGLAAALMMYALARRCGAREWRALAATALLVCNPCYLFLSFSFMTEIPFLAALIAAQLAFANAEGETEIRWLWISAALGVIAFMVRPFAGAAILGSMGAILLYEALAPEAEQASVKRMAVKMTPFVLALCACALEWIWLTVIRTPPWDLARSERHFAYLLMVSVTEYVRDGLLGPLLYLGIVLSPVALLQLGTRNVYRIAALAAFVFAITVILAKAAGARFPATPEMSCFGGWDNVLILRGMPNRFFWKGDGQWVMAALGSVGAAALAFAAIEAVGRLNRAAAAVVIAAGIYWAASIPLWLFNDRYYLVLVPAGALILALAPMPERIAAKIAVFAMTAVMGLLSLGGTYAYQRGLEAVIAARDIVEKRGVPRSAIDAGYELNGSDLYRFPRHGEDTLRGEAGIPMITSRKVDEYTIASRPFAGMKIVGRLSWPGPFGLGHREIYILRRIRHPQPNGASKAHR